MRHILNISTTEALKAFFFSRLLIASIAILSSQIVLEKHYAREGHNYHMNIDLNPVKVLDSLRKIALSADASWYVGIAINGYDEAVSPSDKARNWTFFPFFPLLMKCASAIVGNHLLAGLIISNVCFFFGLVFMHRLQCLLGLSAASANRAIWFVALYPTSYFFSVPLTESLFFFLSVVAFYYLRREKYIVSGVLLCLAIATRPTGAMMLPAVCMALKERGILFTRHALAFLLLAPIGIVGFMWLMYILTTDPLAFYRNQLAWGRGQMNLMGLFSEIVAHPLKLMIGWNFILLNLGSGVFVFAASIYFLFKRQYTWALFLIVPLAFMLNTGTVQSMARFAMVMFPAFFALSEWTRNAVFDRVVVVTSSALLALMTALYALHVTSAMA
ncbi:MAG: hypothetical protein IT291_04340 [Deltaproteobacteria bacterium]|nr:hypothetical protein [Deltaproteobacteria bacterium]